jgi:hypothetical protein
MAARQIWLFLTEGDVREMLERLERHEPGLVASQGRYLRGEPSALLLDPQSLERRESIPGETRHYLLHRKHCADVIVHRQPAGPFADWSQIDEERTDCLVLRVPRCEGGDLQPGRLYAHTSFWRSATKVRKRPMFALWANSALRWLLTQYPSTSVDFMRVGLEARQRALRGELQLSYLYRRVAVEAVAGAPATPPPEGTITSAEPDDHD